jgi:hypothetical protein
MGFLSWLLKLDLNHKKQTKKGNKNKNTLKEVLGDLSSVLLWDNLKRVKDSIKTVSALKSRY